MTDGATGNEYRVWRTSDPDVVATVWAASPRDAGERYARDRWSNMHDDEFDLVVEVVESGIRFSCLVEVEIDPTFWSTARPIGVRK